MTISRLGSSCLGSFQMTLVQGWKVSWIILLLESENTLGSSCRGWSVLRNIPVVVSNEYIVIKNKKAREVMKMSMVG